MAADPGLSATQEQSPSHPHDVPWLRRHLSRVPTVAGHAARPTMPSQAVMVDVGEHAGALVLHAPPEREGLEVEIHPVSDPSRRTHVWVLPRASRGATVYAAVFPSLSAGDYAVMAPDGSVGSIVPVPANTVTRAVWS